MPIKTMTPSKEQVDELRNMFIQKYETNPPLEKFHPVDIDRVRNDDLWCTRFLEMYDLDMKLSFEKLWSTCIWRQKFGANDSNETNVRMDYLSDGVIFPHNCDVDGKPLLIFKTSKHIKGAKDMNELLKVLIYWVERIQRERHLEKMTIFFDMDGTGLSNMDLDFIKMIIETFKMYYPNTLNYILVFEMAWILNAAFKIVKALLPEKAVEILKIITKKTINTYVDKDNCLTSWGGNDNYVFSFEPEVRKPKQNGSVSLPQPDSHPHHDKKVHFNNNLPNHTHFAEMPTQMPDIPDQFTPQDPNEDMLRVTPADYLQFTHGDAKDCTLELACISSNPVTYKIQTTSPEKFRVRPRCGILYPGSTITVNILLKPEHSLSENGKDKFLIMCMPSMDIQSNQVTEFWKKAGQQSVNMEQHRLYCTYKEGAEKSSQLVANGVGSANKENKQQSREISSEETRKLEKQLRNTQILQIITLVFLFILLGAVIYLLKLQMCDVDGCSTNRDSAAESVDFATCAKGKADL
ncbi:motile sperm domain-containing protein 2 [Musca domestica]|uniref:Motile sperm domain-containing protein 2 n=1 Tax=Musca domestica TaxID=7370 RepID=A0A1I8MH83_MUSDO|nr:motile sperm domain-containing protein 2 [Musca domestica]